MTYEVLVHNFMIICIGVLAVTAFFCLIRAIIGPRVADRMVGINMTGTQVIVMIAFVALLLNESGLLDVAIIYAVLSFLAVIILTKVFTGACLDKRARDRKKREERAGRKVTEE